MLKSRLENITKKCINRYENAFAVDKSGLISMLLDQLSHPILCFKEVIQNSIDEHATYIDVITQIEKSENRTYVSIEDNGLGMNKEKVKRYLTLFDSTKEDLIKTIGEMGVGKIFAFALNPEYLVVETGDGSEGYKIIFKEDMSGELLSIPPRKGTRVTVVMKYDDKYSGESFVEEVQDSIKKNCCYVQVPIKLNNKKINVDFDVDTPYKACFDYGLTKGVVALTGDTGYTLLKGGILLEKGSKLKLREEENNNYDFDSLEILVDSFEFNQPLSRNAVNKDWFFEHVMQYVRAASTRLLQNLIDNYPEIERKNNSKTRRVRDYLHNVLASQDVDFLPWEIKTLRLFKTVDGACISYDDIVKAISKERVIYYSSWNKFGANEITYFSDRGIPVVQENHQNLKKLFYKRYGCGIQHVGEGLMIEGMINWKKKYKSNFQERTFLDLIFHLLWGIQRGMFKRYFPNKSTSHKIRDISPETNSGNSSFDWNKIKEFCFESFLDLKGKPREDLTLFWWENAGKVILNIHNPYIKSMIELSKIDPQLSKYYTLCEIASSKTVFPYADHKTVEDFTIELGRGLLENDR